MENIIFYEIICTLLLIIVTLYVIAKKICKIIVSIAEVLADNQQEVSKQIDSIKINNIQLSTYDCIAINNTIAALTRIEEKDCMSYKQEISLLNKILLNGQQ